MLAGWNTKLSETWLMATFGAATSTPGSTARTRPTEKRRDRAQAARAPKGRFRLRIDYPSSQKKPTATGSGLWVFLLEPIDLLHHSLPSPLARCRSYRPATT